MVIDYSKWDKLELSDDSDIEVHPNVDKNSFIRWKQRDIHEKREQMKHNIQQLEVSTEMNTDLLKRIDQLISVGEKGEEKLSGDISSAVAIANKGFDKDKPESATADDQHNYTEMLENLMEQVHDGVKSADDTEKATLEKIKEHRQKLDDVLKDQFKQLEELREERGRHILSEDIHTGFDSTQITHKPKETESKKQAKEQIEVLNPGAEEGSSAPPPPQPKSVAEAEEDDDVQASPDTIEFGKIPIGEYAKNYAYLTSHPNIISEQEKDGLMMEAFQQQLAGNEVSMRRIVHNALLIQYCHTLGPDGVRMFFSKINDKNHPAYNAFIKDVDFTVNHIKQRCEVISQERQDQQENVEQIQLHAVDPNTEIVVNLPDSGNPDAMAVYDSFTTEMRNAIESKQLDEINKVLAEMPVEEAEELVKKFDECGVLSVEEKIYDATEWQKEKQRLQQEEERTASSSNPKVEEMD